MANVGDSCIFARCDPGVRVVLMSLVVVVLASAVEHFQPLGPPRDLQRFFRACEQLARAQIFLAIQGIFKDVRFYPMLNFGHFGAPLFSLCFYTIMNFGHFWAPSSPLTFHNVKNHGGGGAEEEPGKTNRNETTKKDTGGGTNNVFRVFW